MTKHNKSDRTKADEEFLKTYDILQLQNALGHKHIKSTWNYIARKNMLIRPFEEAKAWKKPKNAVNIARINPLYVLT